MSYLASFAVNVVTATVLTLWLQRRSACGCAHCELHRRMLAAGRKVIEPKVVAPTFRMARGEYTNDVPAERDGREAVH